MRLFNNSIAKDGFKLNAGQSTNLCWGKSQLNAIKIIGGPDKLPRSMHDSVCIRIS